MDLAKKILSDPINRWIFSREKKDIYLVGGYVRDLLRCQIPKDKDFVLKDKAREIARKAASEFKGTFIELKKSQTYRVALGTEYFIDFTNISESIENDLLKRDFTVNSIAWSPETGIVSNPGSLDDLRHRKIKVVKPDNLIDDPLRILRAYRLAAYLNFSIDINTRRYLRKYAAHLVNTAPERITEEIFRLLDIENSLSFIKLCNKDKVLSKLLNISPSNLNINIDILEDFDKYLNKNRSKLAEISRKKRIIKSIYRNKSQGLNRYGLIRLSLLLLNQDILHDNKNLTLSNINRKAIINIHNSYELCRARITESELFQIYKAAGDSTYEISLILSAMRKRRDTKFINRAIDFLRIKKRHLLTGHEIQKLLNIKPGAIIGDIQGQIQRMQFMGLIKNKSEARDLIISNLT
jgi:tRNA nucleotidyltransferase (CCA-adding enzyme)